MRTAESTGIHRSGKQKQQEKAGSGEPCRDLGADLKSSGQRRSAESLKKGLLAKKNSRVGRIVARMGPGKSGEMLQARNRFMAAHSIQQIGNESANIKGLRTKSTGQDVNRNRDLINQ
jgi:hypothetical protein